MTTFQTGHIGLNVTSLDRSRQFYQEMFGFELIGESKEPGRKFVFLGRGGNPALTLWEQSTGSVQYKQPGLHHLSFYVETIGQLQEFEQKIKERKVPLIYPGVVAHAENAKSAAVYFEDPDGLRLEVFTGTGGENYKAPTEDAPACGFF